MVTLHSLSLLFLVDYDNNNHKNKTILPLLYFAQNLCNLFQIPLPAGSVIKNSRTFNKTKLLQLVVVRYWRVTSGVLLDEEGYRLIHRVIQSQQLIRINCFKQQTWLEETGRNTHSGFFSSMDIYSPIQVHISHPQNTSHTHHCCTMLTLRRSKYKYQSINNEPSPPHEPT